MASRSFNSNVTSGEAVGQAWLRGTDDLSFTREDVEKDRSPSTPPLWDSAQCMTKHRKLGGDRDVDPGGYLVFTDAREQMGNERIVISDGLVIAKALDRTLVEYPSSNSRIASADARRGFCMYWDCDRLCAYHRILDLWTFRSMLRRGSVSLDKFLQIEPVDDESNLLKMLATRKDIINFFGPYREAQVIVLKRMWKGGRQQEPQRYMRPNRFYEGLVRDLISRQKGWERRRFIAVQWRTETSRGNLTQCYDRYVGPAVEEHRLRWGLGRNQVYFNTDLVGRTSGTYRRSVVRANQGVVEMIKAMYPLALNNTVTLQLCDEQDTGVKAIVSGLVSASSRVLLSSSHGASGSNKCQKLNSKYINMIVEWRTDVYRGDEDSVVALFPGRVSYFYLCVGFVVALTLLAKGYASFGLARRRRRTSKRVLRRAGSVQSVS